MPYAKSSPVGGSRPNKKYWTTFHSVVPSQKMNWELF